MYDPEWIAYKAAEVNAIIQAFTPEIGQVCFMWEKVSREPAGYTLLGRLGTCKGHRRSLRSRILGKRSISLTVTPAQAGVQPLFELSWIPAYAGMTNREGGPRVLCRHPYQRKTESNHKGTRSNKELGNC